MPKPLLAALVLASLTASAQAGEPIHRLAPGSLVLHPTAANDCAGGLVYDDGSFESRVALGGVDSLDTVMAFELPSSPVALRELCLCWTRTGGATTADFDFLVYAADGPGGQPGNLETGLGGVRVDNVPLFPQTAFYRFDLAQLGLQLTGERVYIGPSWDPAAQPNLRACGDDNGGGTQSLFDSTDLGASWEDLGGAFPNLDALGVRAKVGDLGGFSCTPDDTTLCLNQGRFQVRLTWHTNQGQTGSGHVVPFGSNDSGLLYFFNPSNWEMLIKALDGCAVNQHYWVFFAAVTNVQFTLTVTDSQTGQSKVYTNPLGTTAPTVTDTTAFPCTP